ncbi:PRC-barrel domain-containing protein [Pontiellaceae bacterium B1224]|nr:PRC-barrel domain-containing protein [Pontiellaceae bacterium B1224]
MLHYLHELKQFRLEATDGTIGRVKDFLFDEKHWTVRYMVADTGNWLPGRKVLVSPVSLGTPDWDNKRFEVKLTKEQVESQPGLDADASVSHQHERNWFKAYGYPSYWVGGYFTWGYGVEPSAVFTEPPEGSDVEEEIGEPHLRSLEEIRSYKVSTENDTFGRVEDLVMDDATWTIRYVQLDTRKWLPGQSVLLSPEWFNWFDWDNKTLGCELTRDTIERIPKLAQGMPVTRSFETALFEHFDKPAYWWETKDK